MVKSDTNIAQNLPEIVDIETLPDNSKFKPKYIPIESIIELRQKNLSPQQIATLLGCTRSSIVQRLKSIEISNHYVKNRAHVLAWYQSKIIQSITDADLQKANLRDKIISASILYDKERLETGQSTQILGYADALKARETAEVTVEQIKRIIVRKTAALSDTKG